MRIRVGRAGQPAELFSGGADLPGSMGNDAHPEIPVPTRRLLLKAAGIGAAGVVGGVAAQLIASPSATSASQAGFGQADVPLDTCAPLFEGGQLAVRNRSLLIDAVAEGAKGDGIADDRAALTNAHAFVPASGGRLLLRSGVYRMSSRLIMTKQGVTIEGEGVDATTLLIDVAAFQVAASDIRIRNLTIKGNVSTTQLVLQMVNVGGFRNWRFENVKFDGVGVVPSRIGAVNDAGVAALSGTGLSSFVEFDRCEFTGFSGDGSLSVRGVDDVTVTRCYFHDAGTSAVNGELLKFSAGAQYWQVLNSRFERGSRDAIDCYDAHRGLIDGCVIRDMGVHGIEMKVVSLAAHNPADRNRVTNNHVVNCGLGQSSPAMQLATSNVIATGNFVEGGSATGLRCGKTTNGLSKSQNIVWANNHVKGTKGYGYFMGGVEGAVISGNIATNCATSGFHVAQKGINSSIVGGASNNLSRNNGAADVWA